MSINAFDQASATSSPWQPPPPLKHGPQGPNADRVWCYAGFWWRVLAWLIDSAVLWTVESAIGSLAGRPRFGIRNDATTPDQGAISNVAYTMQPEVMHSWGLQHWHVTAPGLADLLAFVVPLLYFTLLESSRWQATVGKRVCHLRVTGLDGGRITPWRAIGRYAGKFVSAFILGIGFMMAGWTTRKQALHDLMAETLVVRLRRPNDIVQFRPPAG
ncbi:RDD family protein [Lichenicoccus sp.]|uniref:RDD family protein n=1 Tax=Lichenicoccus sp. TaxID=2781899 RepID=UPI003D0C74FD